MWSISRFAPIVGNRKESFRMEEQVASLTYSIDVFWVLLAGFMVFFMQAGFALVEAGFTRAKNIAHTMMMNIMVFCIGAIGYYLVGFGIQYGGVNYTYPATATAGEWAFSPITLGAWGDALAQPLLIAGNGIMGLSGFMLNGITASEASAGMLAFFLFQMVFMDTAATIPTGSMAERLKFSGFVLMSFFIAMFMYPLVANWVWGGGWLANLGRSIGLGNGMVDFAGSGAVHMVGGSIALAGAMVLGPRIGKFNKDGSANVIPAHNIAMGTLGAIILFFGWFGFNPGSALGISGAGINLVALAAVNTLLAGAAGGVAAMAYTWLVSHKKPEPGMMVNGTLAGLVAVTAPCAFIEPLAAVFIGAVGGVIVILASTLLERLKIDDPVGAAPVHLFNGAWGVLALGLFASGNPITAGWNGVSTPVTGLLYGNPSQFGAQFVAVVAIALVTFGLSYGFFKILMAVGVLRSKPEDELAGLDIPELGTAGYAPDVPMPELPHMVPPARPIGGLATPATGD
jgi:Amt family ammonium transporter